MRLGRFGSVILIFCLFAGVATAGNYSFTGLFTQDDQSQVFLFTAGSPGAIVETLSYGGGTNSAGATILPGGFDPVLSVFNASGGLVASSGLVDVSTDNPSANADPVTGNTYDQLLTLANPGTYALVLTENGNFANSSTYGAGFSETGQGNFTASANGCGGTDPFCENPFVPNRTGNWAVDILGVDSASEVTNGVPEPASVLLLATGIAGLALLGRRGKRA